MRVKVVVGVYSSSRSSSSSSSRSSSSISSGRCLVGFFGGGDHGMLAHSYRYLHVSEYILHEIC